MEIHEAESAAQQIVDDLKDRKGLSDEWENIPPEIQKEIKGKWRDIILGETM